MPELYIIAQTDQYFPGIVQWIDSAWTRLLSVRGDCDWSYRLIRADAANSFHALDAYSLVAETRGPVLILGAIKQAPITILHAKLEFECILLHVVGLACVDDIYGAMSEVLRRHDAGEPHVPIRYAAAVQIFRKFQKHNYWGGEGLNKAFIWADDVPNGRGVTGAVAPYALMVAGEMANRGLLKSKRSNGKLKYGLNREQLPTINAIFACDWERLDRGLHKWLMNGQGTVPASEIQEAIDTWESS
jgi:hypothetical protein